MSTDRLTVPDRYKDGFEQLLLYPTESFNELLAAMERVGARLNIQAFIDQVAVEVGGEVEHLPEILRAIHSLYAVQQYEELKPERTVELLRDALASTGEERLSPETSGWKETGEFLKAALHDDSPLAITSKAAGLRQEDEHRFCSAKIISDLRLVFGSEATAPAGAFVLHRLQVSYHAGGSSRLQDLFLSLTGKQLEELQIQLREALELQQNVQSWIALDTTTKALTEGGGYASGDD